jgi:MFS family permease
VLELKSKDGSVSWIYATLPINIAMGPVSTYIQIVILQQHGTVVDVGLAITLFNAVAIPAAMIWGFATDRFHSRKRFVVASYFATSGSLILFLFASTIHGVEVLYSVFSLVSSASATPLNLLVMETEPKSRWASGFAKFSMVSSVGVTIGLLLGVAWGDFLPFPLLIIPLAILSFVSGVVSVAWIKEPSVVFEREMIVMVRRSFFERLLVLPVLFLRIPELIDFRRVLKALRHEVTKETEILYLSIILFYVSSGIFNTSLVPSLYSARLSKSQIFLVFLIGMAIQTIAFRYVGPYIEKSSLKISAVGGLLLRSVSYAFIGMSTYFLSGILYLGSTIFLYSLAAGLAFAAYYAASNVMIFETLGRSNQGSVLGVYSAIVGLATMFGSFVSGYMSFYLGYAATFTCAGAGLVVAAILTALMPPTKPVPE